ncbi:ATP-binding protein [Lentzea indica]|uniref:ATP-binding protein n=1 Tax=Lentzea indica TaxID=2604800 RepID=UPI00143AF797|nr:tetratricopeptide repeat protein [Lentzea indica]
MVSSKVSSKVSGKVSGSVPGVVVQAHTISGDVQFQGGRESERVMPRQLPAAVPHLFTGRQSELRALTTALDSAQITVIRGVGGVGKTWLALQWAHRNIERFPDGQLFVNLRGFSPDGKPASPGTVLHGFLKALQVAPSALPEDLDAKAGLYRSVMAERRMLVVLDNAADAAQVAPLLPGGANCSVIVTSRRDLSGLVTAHGARSVPLDVLDRVSALQLLASHLGPRRLAAEPEAIKELLRCSAGLPLALGIVAARASTNPRFPLALLADELHDTTTRLDGLDTGDTDSSLRAVLSWSHAGLSDDAAHLFGLLGAVPGPDIAVTSVFSLDSQPAARIRLLLRELEAAHLVLQHEPGRYKMHDLVRLYAREQSAALDLRPALTRLFEHYLTTAACAVRVHYPHGRHSNPIEETRPVQDISDPRTATAWIEAERQNLVAIARFAAEHGCPILPNRLSTTMWAYLLNHSHHHDALSMHTYALRASWRAGDRAGECRAFINLGTVYERLRRYPEASGHLERGLELSREIGDRAEEGRALSNLGIVFWLTGDYVGAVDRLEAALALSREFADPSLESYALCKLGFVYRSLNRVDDAVSCLRAALAMTRHIGDRVDEAFALSDLGACYVLLDRPDEAFSSLQQALALSRELGDRAVEALTLTFLGAHYARTKCYPDALAALNRSAAVSRRLGDKCLEAKAFNELGEVYSALGDDVRAIGCHCFAIVRAKSIGDAYQLGRAHEWLARAHERCGSRGDADHHRREAAEAFRLLTLPAGAVVQTML